jgi:hypothetical protein
MQGLDRRYSYYVLYASFGDKWCILSYLESHLSLYPDSRILASDIDRHLVGVFLSSETIQQRFIFVDRQLLTHFSSLFNPSGASSAPLADPGISTGLKLTVSSFFMKHGLPPASIRHLHVVKYPYFNDLINLHGVSYGTLLKTILYLPNGTRPAVPSQYSEADYRELEQLLGRFSRRQADVSTSAILFNAINFSHSSLSSRQISLILQLLVSQGFTVLLNLSQATPELSRVLLEVAADYDCVQPITIPGRLLALVSDHVTAVIGVLGGAMNIAVQFSHSHVLSLQTPALWAGCSEDELLGPWGKERIWEWIDQDWPCLRPGRIVRNVFIGDPELLSHENLSFVIGEFMASIQP